MGHYEQRVAELIAEAPDPVATQRKLDAWSKPPAEAADGFYPSLWATETLWCVRKRAKKKGWPCDVTPTWIARQLERQHYACAITGIAFSARNPAGAHKRPFMPSLDRIDSAKGYTTDNLRIVCVAVNTLIQDWGAEVFLEIARAVRVE